MNRAEAVKTIRDMATGALADELRYYMEDVDHEADDWDARPCDLLDALEDAETANDGHDRALARQIEAVLRAIGMREQVKAGEEVMEMSGGKCRTMKAGAWVSAKAYSEFV